MNGRRWKAGCLAVLCAWFNVAFATLELELTRGVSAATPIAVGHFTSGTFESDVSEVVAHDLSLSGRFKVVGRDEDLSDTARWKSLGVSYVLTGQMRTLGDRYQINFQLRDALKPQSAPLLSHQVVVDGRHLRSGGHRVSDEVYEYITGQRGFFNTKIAYVTAKRYTYYKGRYTLNVADYDGHDSKAILVSGQPVMSPSWGPDGRTVAYVSFENHKAQIFSEDIYTGARRLISSSEGINGAPAWSPDGRKIAMVLTRTGYPKIFMFDLVTHQLTQLTQGVSLDTEPSWSPDGRHLVFTSDRGGSPQVYRVSVGSRQVERVSYQGKYNAKPSYSRDGRKLVMLHNDGSGFYVAVLDLTSGQLKLLTHGGYEESPTWSPNGELVMYATGTAAQGTLGIVSVDGRLSWRLPEQTGPVQEPAWSPFLNYHT